MTVSVTVSVPRSASPILAIESLRVLFPGATGEIPVVDDVSLTIAHGEIVCLVGESGSGKSLTALSVLRLIPSPGRIGAGTRIRFANEELLALDHEALRAIRGRQVGMVFQEPSAALNPVLRIGTQLVDAIRAHVRCTHSEAWKRAVDALASVGIADPETRARQYPHELSGGMRQRVVLAMALVHAPPLLIADEPTTALDVTVQAQILDLLRRAVAERDMALLLITHDLGVVAEMATRVLVMYAGRLVEEAPAETIFTQPAHPYTQALLAAVPSLATAGERLVTIAGQVPAPGSVVRGCAFRARCPHAIAMCESEAPPLVQLGSAHRVRCHLAHENMQTPAAREGTP